MRIRLDPAIGLNRAGRPWPNDERHFRDLFENACDFIYTVDLRGNFTSVNRTAERLTGYSTEELLASNIRQIVAPESLAAMLRLMDRTAKGASPAIYEVEIVAKTGHRVPVEISSRLLYRGAQPAGFHGIARDLSVRREADRGARRRTAHLEALNAIIAAADAAPDLPMLLEVAIDRLLAALASGIGGIWTGDHHVVRGLPEEIGSMIVEAARSSGDAKATARCVADLRGETGNALTPRWASIGVTAYITLPILMNNRCIGALVAASAYPRNWSPEEVALVEAVGRQMAATAEGLVLFRETQQRASLMERLVALSAKLNRPSSVGALAAAIGEATLSLTGAKGGAVYLRRPDAVTCLWAKEAASDYAGLILQRDGARPERAGPMLVHDVLTLPPDDGIRCAAETEGYRAVGAWPLTYEGREIASVVCCFDAPHTWSRPEYDVFQTFTWQAASALENARLYDAQIERARWMETLYELSSVLRAAQSLEQIFSTLGEHASRLVQADHAMLAMLDSDRQSLSCVYASGVSVEPGRATFPVAETVFGQVLQTGASYLTDDVMREHAPALPAWLLQLYRSLGPLSVVALRSDHGLIGALAIGRMKGGRPFAQTEIRLLQGIAEMAGTAIGRASLHHNLEEAYFQLVLSLARALDAKDAYTQGHSERLVTLTEALARDMSLSEEEVKDIRWATVLHDIGKIGAPDAILFKPGPLTDQEWEIMRQHPVVGEQILLPVKRMRGVAKIIRHHQERWDGTGYPDRLRGEEIPLGARIIAVADAFGAMTDARPYKDAVTQTEALEELIRCAGTQFDSDVVTGFCRLLRYEHRASRETRPARGPKAAV